MFTNPFHRPDAAKRSTHCKRHGYQERNANQALKEFIQRREQKRLVELFGSLPADDDYKKGRE